MILLSFMQMIVFLLALIIGGEFGYIKQYACNIFIEKTENRKNYVETMLSSKIDPIYDAAEDMVQLTENILKAMGASPSDISQSKDVNKEIIRRTAPRLAELMRVSSVNDAYIILDSGELYYRDNVEKKSGFYIRDWEISSANINDNSDFLVEVGSADIAEAMGISLDSGWSTQLTLNGSSTDFFTVTMQTAKANPGIEMRNLGYWSDFTAISSLAQPSMKYTLPLVASDGTVFGVMGIGLMEKTILSAIPSNDFFNKSSCYILGVDDNNDGNYRPIIHSGAIYNRLVTDETIINTRNKLAPEIYNFNDNSSESIGCISKIKVYNPGSPYYLKHNWALISMANAHEILSIYYTILGALFVSTLISICVTFALAMFVSRTITRPVEKISLLIDEKMNEGNIIHFEPSGITEIDKLSSLVSELQVSVRKQASRVSRIISMADMGFGVFMYDNKNKTVFVGDSLIKLAELKDKPKGDIVINREEFYDMVGYMDKSALDTIEAYIDDDSAAEETEAQVEFYSKNLDKWIRCKVMKNEKRVIGFFLDITAAELEKQKIEYERDYDLITGLLNRRAYYKKIEHFFENPEQLKIGAFIMCDLDNLKYVNDTYGHDYGDKYIKGAADALRCLNDYGAAARLSGDEFNAFIYGFDSKDEAREVIAEMWKDFMSRRIELADGTMYKLRASGGIAWYPGDSEDYSKLLKYSDFAMYTVKHSTKGQIAEFDMAAYNKDSILMTGVEEMNRIFDNASVKYAFQSIISAKTGKIYGYEALMRPQSEAIRTPLEFIRIAKSASRLYEVERLTWFMGLGYFKELRDSGAIPTEARLFINSLPDCRMKNDDVAELEEKFGDFLDKVVLEILEGEQVNEAFMKGKQKRIHDWGGMIALDDFGCGYNSEYALITLSPDLIKIDRSIVNGCDTDVSRQKLIMNLVSYAGMHNALVLAEGIESRDEMITVIDCGVDLLQGYYIDRPGFEPKPVPNRIVEEIDEIHRTAEHKNIK